MTKDSATISLGMQTSGLDTRTNDYVLELRRLLAEYCSGPYSAEVEEFALILRIGGDLQEFDFEGCDRIRRSHRDKYITVDLGVPTYRWKGVSAEALRKYLVESVETGLLCCLRRLEKDKTHADSAKLLADFGKVKKLYLA